MEHPLLETVSNFVWRIAVPRPWPAEHVRPERSDAAVDRGRISRNNARANLMLAVQSIIVTPFTCVYVSAATHLGRQPGVFPFRGNFRAFRAIVAAEGVRGLFKGAFPLMWAHMLLSYVRSMRIRGLNPRTKKWEPYTRLTRLARWACSLLIHMLESVVRLHGKQRTASPAPHGADTAVLATAATFQAYCMMVESTPEFSHPISAMLQLWKEGSWMRGWLFSAFIHLSSGDSMYRLPWNAVRLRLMTDPRSRLWGAWNAFGLLTPLSGWRAYLWSALPMYLAQTATMVLCRVIVDAIMGPFEMLKSEESMARLRKREHAPLTPYLKGIENRHRMERRETQKNMKEAFKKHKRHEKALKRRELAALNKMEIEMLLKGAFDALDEGKTGSITFRSIAYGKMGPKLKERLSDEAMESLTEDPAGEVDKEMWDAFFSGVMEREFKTAPEFKKFMVDCMQEAGFTSDDILANQQQQMQGRPGMPQRAMMNNGAGGGGMPNHPALSGGGPPR